MKPLSFGLLSFFFCFINCFSQEGKLNDEFTFMFYNAENLFDPQNDSLSQDDEFTFEGNRRWHMGRLRDKSNRVAKVILAAGKWTPPILVGLCEIESYQVLQMLVRQTPLSKSGYKFIHKDSPDSRGIDVALMYRPELFKPLSYRAIALTDTQYSSFKTRDILQVSGIVNHCDTLHLFVNHWPSRYGGLMETIRLRKLAALALKKAVDDLLDQYPRAKIICMGDFNDTPGDESLSNVLNAMESDDPGLQGQLVNLSSQWMSRGVQTLKNGYSWQVFDQWIVSDYLIHNTGCLQLLQAEIFDAPFLLEPDKKYGGLKPKRTYVGFKYQEGFSDHLPVLLKFSQTIH